MGFSNAGALIDELKDYLAQDDIALKVFSFVELAEARFSRELRVRQMYAIEPAQFIPANGILALPDDFLEIVAHTITANPPFTPAYVPPNQFMSLVSQSGTGYPDAYTIIGDNIHFSPAPDATDTYSYELYYVQKIPSLLNAEGSAATNWLLDLAPDIYLYGSLIEAEPYLVNDSRIATWTALYERARKSLQNLSARSRYRPDSAMRSYTAGHLEGKSGRYP